MAAVTVGLVGAVVFGWAVAAGAGTVASAAVSGAGLPDLGSSAVACCVAVAGEVSVFAWPVGVAAAGSVCTVGEGGVSVDGAVAAEILVSTMGDAIDGASGAATGVTTGWGTWIAGEVCVEAAGAAGAPVVFVR